MFFFSYDWWSDIFSYTYWSLLTIFWFNNHLDMKDLAMLPVVCWTATWISFISEANIVTKVAVNAFFYKPCVVPGIGRIYRGHLISWHECRKRQLIQG